MNKSQQTKSDKMKQELTEDAQVREKSKKNFSLSHSLPLPVFNILVCLGVPSTDV